jgi:ferredoxin
MLINSVRVVYFSPTGTTKKVLEGILEGIGAEKVKFSDLLKPQGEIDLTDNNKPDMVIIGMPTYVSRIPPEATVQLKKLKGNGIPVALVAVYGNNKFGDILLEMKDIAKSANFITVAAAAFIGEHSFSTEEKPIAAGRPDAKDIADAKAFGESIKTKMTDYNANIADSDLKVPGEFPYREWHKLPAQPPVTDENLCNKCGKCKSACPVDAITINETIITNSDLCIFCCACIKICPTYARRVIDTKLLEITERLYNNCSDRKDPEIFI